MQSFPTLDELLLNPVIAAGVVVVIVNVLAYALDEKPTWLSLVVSVTYMLAGHFAAGRTSTEQIFTAFVYAFLMVAPLAHVDGTLLHRLFGLPETNRALVRKQFFQPWL